MDNLNSQQLSIFKQQLESLLKQIQESFESTDHASDTVVLDQSRLGRLSRMDAMQQQEMAKAELSQLKIRLKLIQKALVKFEQNEFGWCEDCDQAIPIQRLQIKPESQYCIKCQGVRENT
jgi:DnaK suppressor protein